MKKYLLVFALTCAAYALEPGKNYDFMQKNGQNVLGAELMSETPTEYVVRLKYVPKPITLKRDNLTEIPVLSKVQPAPVTPKFSLRRDFALHTSFGVSYPTFGDIGRIFRAGYEMRFGTDWQLFEKTIYRIRALTLMAEFSNYQSSPRRIQTISAYAGPKILVWHFTSLDATLFASPLIGLSYTDLRGYTFSSNYTTLSALGLISLEKRWLNLAFAAQLYVNYLFDSSLSFASSGISIAARYPLGSAAPF